MPGKKSSYDVCMVYMYPYVSIVHPPPLYYAPCRYMREEQRDRVRVDGTTIVVIIIVIVVMAVMLIVAAVAAILALCVHIGRPRRERQTHTHNGEKGEAAVHRQPTQGRLVMSVLQRRRQQHCRHDRVACLYSRHCRQRWRPSRRRQRPRETGIRPTTGWRSCHGIEEPL